MKLTNPTDDELNAAFAEKIAGWRKELLNTLTPNAVVYGWVDATGLPLGRRSWFTDSFDAVLPWLEKCDACFISMGTGKTHDYVVRLDSRVGIFAVDKSLPRAAVIALLRAHGVEVEFTEQPSPSLKP